MPRLILLAATALLSGCIGGTDRYVGPVTGCGVTTAGVLDIRGKNFIFTPDQGVLQIHGTVSKDGKLAGTESEGPINAREPYILHFEGTEKDDVIIGKLIRPDCTLDVTLNER
jgi:hypothetical protein